MLLPQVRPWYGAVAAPLTALLRKDGFGWSDEAVAAFTALKHTLTFAPMLALPDFNQPFIMECDASFSGFGSVLLQEKRPIAFLSRPAAPRHQSLAAYERDLIGLVQAVRHWRPYIHTYVGTALWSALTITASNSC